MCAECQPTPPRHRSPSLQTGSPAGQSVQQLPLPPWEGGIGPQALGLRRPPGAGPCPRGAAWRQGPSRDEARPGSGGSEDRRAQRWAKLRPEGAERRVRNPIRFWPVSFPKGGRDTLLSMSRLGPHAASAGLPCTPGSHAPRSAHL